MLLSVIKILLNQYYFLHLDRILYRTKIKTRLKMNLFTPPPPENFKPKNSNSFAASPII